MHWASPSISIFLPFWTRTLGGRSPRGLGIHYCPPAIYFTDRRHISSQCIERLHRDPLGGKSIFIYLFFITSDVHFESLISKFEFRDWDAFIRKPTKILKICWSCNAHTVHLMHLIKWNYCPTVCLNKIYHWPSVYLICLTRQCTWSPVYLIHLIRHYTCIPECLLQLKYWCWMPDNSDRQVHLVFCKSEKTDMLHIE